MMPLGCCTTLGDEAWRHPGDFIFSDNVPMFWNNILSSYILSLRLAVTPGEEDEDELGIVSGAGGAHWDR